MSSPDNFVFLKSCAKDSEAWKSTKLELMMNNNKLIIIISISVIALISFDQSNHRILMYCIQTDLKSHQYWE